MPAFQTRRLIMLAMKPGLGLPTVRLSGFAPAASEVEIAAHKFAVRFAKGALHSLARAVGRMAGRPGGSDHDRS